MKNPPCGNSTWMIHYVECKIVSSQTHHKRQVLSHNIITISPRSAKRASAPASTGRHLHREGGVVGANERGGHAELLEPEGL